MWRECLALEKSAPALAIPLLLRFFSVVGLGTSSVDLLEGVCSPLLRLSASSSNSSCPLKETPSGILPGPLGGLVCTGEVGVPS